MDGNLKAWHSTFKHNSHLHLGGLVPLATSCTAYLNVKIAKRDSKDKPSKLQLKRIAAVKQLSQQVFVRLAYGQHAKMKGGGHQGAAVGQATRDLSCLPMHTSAMTSSPAARRRRLRKGVIPEGASGGCQD